MSLFSVGEPNQPMFLITLILGFVVSLGLAVLLCRRAMVAGKAVAAAAILAPVLGFLFAHLFYCLMQFSFLINDLGPEGFLDFSANRYMLYGGMFGVALALLLAARIGGEKLGKVMDGFAPAAFLFIAAVRIAEGFYGMGYGEYIEEMNFFCRFPFAVYDNLYEMWAWALFAGEALYALIIAAVTLAVRRREPAGDKALLGLGMYGCGQIIFESLRRDDFLRWGFVRCSELFSGVLILIVLIFYLVRGKNNHKNAAKTVLMVLFFLMVALCLLLEFATEGRIPFLQFLETPAQCYICMTAACVVMLGCVLGIRKLSLSGETNATI